MKNKILLVCVFGLLIVPIFPANSTTNNVDKKMSITSTATRGDTNIDWWPMFQHDPQHIGYSTSNTPDKKHLLWTFKAKHEFSFWASAAIVDDRLYTGTAGVNANLPLFGNLFKHNYSGKVFCLNATTSEVIWEYTSRFGIYATPAVADGKVFVCSGLWFWPDGNNTLDRVGDVFCLDSKDGKLLWENRDCGYVQGGPVVIDDKLYFDTNLFQSSGSVFCLNTSTGEEIWRRTIYKTQSPVAIANNKVYVTLVITNDLLDKVYCLNASTGETIWAWNEGNREQIYSGPTVADGKVYVATTGYGYIDEYGSHWVPGDLHCLDAENGTLLWQSDLSTVFGWTTPAVAYGNVYIGSGKGGTFGDKQNGFYCVNATDGQLVWSRSGLFPNQGFQFSRSGSFSPAIADGKVYFGCDSILSGNCFYCLDAFTGKTLWSYRRLSIAGFGCTSPAIANGKVYVGSGVPSGIDSTAKLLCFG
jgi:outer membrane protein assembly factor BamB